MAIELGPEHDKLINELYRVRDRIQMSPAERRIVEMAIQMLEFLDEPRRPSKLERWCMEDVENLICIGRFEISDGRLIPRVR